MQPPTGQSADYWTTPTLEVTVDPDAIYVHDGNVWTSAGVTAGIDLTLALVADDHGHQAAATVARQLVVYLQRSGGQAQFSALLAGQAADTEPVRDLLSWLRDHLADDLSVAALARQINLSERQFTRVFKAEVGATAADHVEAVRLESACRLLETTNRTIEQIAKTCGFGTPETMNRTFRRRLDTTPGDHRHHFRGDIPAPIRYPLRHVDDGGSRAICGVRLRIRCLALASKSDGADDHSDPEAEDE